MNQTSVDVEEKLMLVRLKEQDPKHTRRHIRAELEKNFKCPLLALTIRPWSKLTSVHGLNQVINVANLLCLRACIQLNARNL